MLPLCVHWPDKKNYKRLSYIAMVKQNIHVQWCPTKHRKKIFILCHGDTIITSHKHVKQGQSLANVNVSLPKAEGHPGQCY